MTTLISWISVDTRGPSAIYIASDSRVTWGSDQKRWDTARKVFAAKTADIFGYCGNVLFPSLVLSQITDLVDKDLLWNKNDTSEDRHSIFVEYLKRSFSNRYGTDNYDFCILHCSRDGKNLESRYALWKLAYCAETNTWIDEKIDLSNFEKNSQLLIATGSGKAAFQTEMFKWSDSPQKGTSRTIFSAFCDALMTKSDSLSGGAPQLVSLDRKTGGKPIGFISEKTRFIYGMPIEYMTALDNIEWVDELFQRMSAETLHSLSGAQRHVRVTTPKPGGLVAFLKKDAGQK